jgi:hypothetical protein
MRDSEFWMTETSFHHYCKLFANGMVGGVGALDLVDSSNAMSLPARLCLNLRHNTHQSAQRLPFFKNPLHHDSGLHTATSITSLPPRTQPCKPSRTISIGPVGDKPEASHPLSRAPKKAHHTPANISISCLSRVAAAKCNPPTQDQEWKYKAETDDNESNGDVWRESHFMLISRFVSFCRLDA